MEVLYSILFVGLVVVMFVMYELVSASFLLAKASIDAYDELSFEFITKEECVQRIEKSKSEHIQKFLKTKFFFFLSYEPEELVEILSYATISVIFQYSVEDLLARSYLYDTLDDKYKKRYLDFLSGVGKQFEVVKSIDSLVAPLGDIKNEELKKDLEGLLDKAKNAASVLVVIMIKKKPGGKRPPKKFESLQNIFVPDGARG